MPVKYLQAMLSLPATEKRVYTSNTKDAAHNIITQKSRELNINRMENRYQLLLQANKWQKKSKPTYQSNYPSETLQLLRLLHDLQPFWSGTVTGHLSGKNFTFQTRNTYQQLPVFKKYRDTSSTFLHFKILKHSEDIQCKVFLLACPIPVSKLTSVYLLCSREQTTLLEDPCP